MNELEQRISALAEALREQTAAETEHDRALRQASGAAAFASSVLSAWDEQELHRGKRMRYGLTKEHAAYARRVRAWAWYEGDVARWIRDPMNASALTRLEAQGFDALSEDERFRISCRPDAPIEIPRPNSRITPPHWPAEPWVPGAEADFFAALRE